jgi:hypothetical protein
LGDGLPDPGCGAAAPGRGPFLEFFNASGLREILAYFDSTSGARPPTLTLFWM